MNSDDSYNNWKVGQQLSSADAETLFEMERTKDIVVATTHPSPGGYFSGPYAGHHFFVSFTNSTFSHAPDIDDSSEDDSPYFLGSFKDQDQLVELVCDFVLDGDHEIPAAIYFHFKEENFATWNSDFAIALPEFYWFRCEKTDEQFQEKLNSRLKERSQLYRLFTDFLQDPENPVHSDIKDMILVKWSFEDLYSNIKFKS